MPSGLYLVALRNDEPISVNAHDMRIADRCIWVNRLNCKLGKAKCLQSRQRNYERTFGAANVIFNPYALLTEITEAEKLVLRKVDAFRVRGRTNLKNEWLTGIDPQEALKLAVCALEESGLEFVFYTGYVSAELAYREEG